MRRNLSALSSGAIIAGIVTLGVLAACSGNMTGATPPVQQAAAGSGTTMAQGMAATTTTSLTNTPVPAASADLALTTSPTPLVLPSTGGYGGTIVAVVASPEPSADVMLGVTLRADPLNAPLREGAPKKGAVHPLVTLELQPEGGPVLLSQGLAGMSFVLPAHSFATAKRFALGLFDLDMPVQPRALFHRKKTGTGPLIAIDDKTKIAKTGNTLSTAGGAITLQAAHRYEFVLYADQPAASPSPGPMNGAIPLGASPLPSGQPSGLSSSAPSGQVSNVPSNLASNVPSGLASSVPSGQASNLPSSLPSNTATPWLASTPQP